MSSCEVERSTEIIAPAKTSRSKALRSIVACLRVARRVAWHGLAVLTLAIIVLAGAASVGVWYLEHTGMLTAAVVGESPVFRAAAAPPRYGRRATPLGAACSAQIYDVSDVRALVRYFAEVNAPYVPTDAADRTIVLMLRGQLAERLGAMGGMTVVGGHGLLTLDARQPTRGDLVYHELVHQWQFRQSWPEQLQLIDALSRTQGRRGGLSAASAFRSWFSVANIASARLSAWQADSLQRVVLDRWTEVMDRGERRPVDRLVEIAIETLSAPEWSSVRKHLVLLGWSHRGLPPTPPPADWRWSDELRRLVYFEAMAYHTDDRCSQRPWITAAPQSPLPRSERRGD